MGVGVAGGGGAGGGVVTADATGCCWRGTFEDRLWFEFRLDGSGSSLNEKLPQVNGFGRKLEALLKTLR